MPEGPDAGRAPDSGRPGSASPRLAILSHSTGEYDARSIRVARSALAAGYEVTMYSRWSAGLATVEEREGYTLIRVPTTGWQLVPGLRRIARRRLARQMAEGHVTQVRSRDRPGQTARPDGGPAMPAGPRAPGTSASVGNAAARTWAMVGRWYRAVLTFPVRPIAWARAVGEVAQPADLWHGMWAGSLPALWRLKRRHGGRTIYDSRDVYLHSRDFARLEWPFRSILAWLERRWAADVDQVLTVNEPYADLIATQLRVPRPLVILNCPEAWTPPSPPPDRFRDALDIPADTAVVLYQGQLISDRGIEQLLEAILLVPDAVLCLLGYGDWAGQLRALSARPPYRGKVFVLPAVAPDELLAWTASADLTVMAIQPTSPNHRYTTPQKMWEAIAAGVPIVASDLPGMASVIQGSGVGVVCDPTSPAAIADAIRRLLSAPPDERAALRAHVLRVAHDRYTWEAQAGALLETYRRLTA